ncbi:MAG: hypothetical protein JWQ78_1028 [Sediminibacterium sp.]|nr:hypothetical protein [Sediminibacterium sp.]
MKNPAVKYAVIALVISIAWTLIEHVLGWNTTKHEIGQYTRMAGAFVFYILIFAAVAETRRQQGGAMSFGEGFTTGAILSVIYSIGIAAWYALYGEVINPQYKTSLMAFERSKLEAVNATPDAIAAKMKEVDMSTGGSVLSYILLIVFMAIFGLVLSAIAGLIFKRKKTVAV